MCGEWEARLERAESQVVVEKERCTELGEQLNNQLAREIALEATLSFLGVGLPDTMPSLGTLIRIGNNYLFAGEWWIVAFPGLALAALILSINLLGDWLRDKLDPTLR